ncbi:MAG TPA: TolC family protein, partial [Gammaproteobacteria bacterium]|nr:TolC family protein [Gammaproteobacteria bacterium]
MRVGFLKHIVTLFVVMFTIIAHASDTNGKVLKITLPEAVVLSLRYNPDVQLEDFQRIVDKFSLLVAEWQFDIHYNLSGAASYMNSVNSGFRTENDTQSVTAGASLLVPLGTQFSLQMVNPLSHAAPSARFYNPSLVFSLTQPLLQGFGPDVTLAPLHIAENQELINRLSLQNTVMATITTIISQYV